MKRSEGVTNINGARSSTSNNGSRSKDKFNHRAYLLWSIGVIALAVSIPLTGFGAFTIPGILLLFLGAYFVASLTCSSCGEPMGVKLERDRFPYVFYVLPRTKCMHCAHSVK